LILRRLTANLKAQNWTAIAIEFLIVVIGVFIGTQVSNWNQARVEKRETQRMIDQLVPEIASQINFFETARVYYRTTRHYADQAFAGWRRDPKISDEQFVIAAYQASQIYGIGTNAQNWALAFGGGQLRNIDNKKLRRNLALVVTADYDPVGFAAVSTDYREMVRHIIPIELQDRIRDECGDRNVFREGFASTISLPATCNIKLDPRQVAATAAKLRSRMDLVDELQWHLAAEATYLANVDGLEYQMLALKRSIEQR